MLLLKIYLVLILIMSFLTFFVYGWDKRSAQKDVRRVPEKTLHVLALCGGWLGAIAGQQMFRHKTQKPVFRGITFAIASLHILLLGIAIWYSYR